MTLTLTAKEAALVVHALLAASPTGGGSDAFTLARRAMSELNVIPDFRRVGDMQIVAHNEVCTD